MGLDMYLTAKKYLTGWDHSDKEDQTFFAKALRAAGLKRSDITTHAPSGYIQFHVAYWRKSNQIHKWFVTHVQKGKDDCNPYDVSRDDLDELVKLCEQVLADHSAAADLLPPQNGFFFGNTDFDEWYFEDLKETVKMLKGVLDNPRLKGWDFEYQSSW